VHPPDLDRAWSAAPHQGVARDLVVALKFAKLLPAAGLMARQVAARAPRELVCGVVVPVPAAPSRLRRRGFDPAEEIAIRLAEATCLPFRRRDLCPDPLDRA
jgi:predicted amidophosphoribosyltransferase